MSDLAYIAAAIPWKASLALAAVIFAVTYWGIPSLFESYVENTREGMPRMFANAIATLRMPLAQGLGYAMVIVCLIGAAWSYSRAGEMRRDEQDDVGTIARIISWFIGKN